MKRILLFILVFTWGCGTKNSNESAETRDSLPATDSTNVARTEPSAPETNPVIVGSDELVNKSTADTLYYAILAYQPVWGDFYRLESISNNLIDLAGSNKDRFAIQLTTSGPPPPGENGSSYYNYCSVAEIKEGKANVLSLLDLGDTYAKRAGFGNVGMFYSVERLAIKENEFALLVKLQNDGGAVVDERRAVYVLNQGVMVPVLEATISLEESTSGTEGTDSFVRTSKFGLEIKPLASYTLGYADLSVEEVTDEQHGPRQRENVTRVKLCQWDGEKYQCGAAEVKK